MNTYYLFSELLTTACTDTDNESSVQKLTRRPEVKIIWSKLIQDRLVLLFSWITLYLHYIKKQLNGTFTAGNLLIPAWTDSPFSLPLGSVCARPCLMILFI